MRLCAQVQLSTLLWKKSLNKPLGLLGGFCPLTSAFKSKKYSLLNLLNKSFSQINTFYQSLLINCINLLEILKDAEIARDEICKIYLTYNTGFFIIHQTKNYKFSCCQLKFHYPLVHIFVYNCSFHNYEKVLCSQVY